VTTPAWDSSTGSLQQWERPDSSAPWRKSGEAAPVAVGGHGLAWGLGLHEIPKGDEGPRKKEGDRRAPAGMFRLTGAFGFAPEARGKLPWQQITATTEAVDDPASQFYNRVVDRQRVDQPDWHSSEHMAAIPGYALGVVVAHNPRNIPGAGSCIFLHLWSGKRVGTAGCTVLREGDLLALVRWLDPARQPVLIQLPEAVMRRDLKGF
jgi:D-alanyl-D-alanine dipeptidase